MKAELTPNGWRADFDLPNDSTVTVTAKYVQAISRGTDRSYNQS